MTDKERKAQLLHALADEPGTPTEERRKRGGDLHWFRHYVVCQASGMMGALWLMVLIQVLGSLVVYVSLGRIADALEVLARAANGGG